jgi:adenosine kinase
MAHADQLSFSTQAPDADLAVISPNDPLAMCNYVAECKDHDLAYIYDPSQQIIRLTGDQLRQGIDGCLLLTVNEYELGMIQEKTNLTLDEILALCDGLLLTLGGDGSRVYTQGEVHDIPSVEPKMIVEPTGAGDAFRGGVLRGLQLGLPWPIIGRMGALAATYVLEHLGTQGHSYSLEQFVKRYRQHFDDEGALDILFT